MKSLALFAVLLAAAGAPPPAASFHGVVSSVDGNVIHLADGLIAVDASHARIEWNRNPATLAAVRFVVSRLKPGWRILANLKAAAVGPNKPLPALSIQPASTPDVSMSGMVTAVDAEHGTFTLLGLTIRLDPPTHFYGNLTAAGIEPGHLFNVEANRDGDELVAVTIGQWIPELD